MKYHFGRRKLAATSLVVTAMLSVAACAESDAGDGEAGTVKFAALGAFTGKSASQNAPVLQGAKTAVKVLNDRGGIDGRKVELIVEDDRGEIAAMVTAARKIAADEDVYAVMLGNGGPGALAVQPVLAPTKLASFSVGTSPKLSNKDWAGFYRMNSNAARTADPVLDLFESVGGKSLGILSVNDDYGAGHEAAIKAAAAKAGVKVAASVRVAPGSSNLTPEIGKLRSAGVDFVTSALLPAETLTATRAIADLGYDATIQMNGADMAFPSQRNLLGKAANGLLFRYFVYPFDPALQKDSKLALDKTNMSDEAKAFWGVWSKEFGGSFDIAGNQVGIMPTYDWWSYDAIMMVAASIEAGADDPSKVVEGIDTIGSFELVSNYENIGQDHEFHPQSDLSFGRLNADGTITYDVS